jgi:transglutaminase-like putative cysteine protease
VPRDFRFRLSLYLTLAAASGCLALSEQPLLPGIGWFIGPLLALMLVAFLVEGRWALPAWMANLLGVLIAAGWGLWIDQRFFADGEATHEMVAPLPAALLPDIGPLLMLLMLVRLFRPKERQDFWVFQGIGLLQVALGCVLGFTPWFGVLLFLYVVCALWALALFSLRGGTEGGAEGPAAGPRPAPRAEPVRPLRWAVGVTAAGLGLCLLLPRGEQDAWNPLSLVPRHSPGWAAAPAEVGAANEIDLNRTGWVEVNDQVAMVVTAEDDEGRPKLDLSLTQRWRGPVLDRYREGRWESGPPPPPAERRGQAGQRALAPPRAEVGVLEAALVVQRRRLTNLGPGRYYLTFEVDAARAGGLFLAEPVWLSPPGKPGETTVVTLQTVSLGVPLFLDLEGVLVPTERPTAGMFRYEQVTQPPPEPDLGPPVPYRHDYIQYLRVQPVPGLTVWTRQVAQRLASRPETGLTPADLRWQRAPTDELEDDHPEGVLVPDGWEKVARALTAYLAHSPEYTYSLTLRRQDRALDPTFDFLSNVKEGHCERYAGGLALMLRALGVPSRIVMGYRGAEPRGDGTYAVHTSQAHAWVEVLVPRRGPGGVVQWHWLQLDPTPDGEPASPPWFTPARWWERGQQVGAFVWRFGIVDYNPEEQGRLWEGLGASLRAGGRRLPGPRWLLGLGLLPVLAGLWLARRARFRPRRVSPAAFYRRLLAILARRRGLRPEPSQTPREFAETVRWALAATMRPELAGVPAEIAELLYRVRFGAVPLTDAEGRVVNDRLACLDAALAGR